MIKELLQFPKMVLTNKALIWKLAKNDFKTRYAGSNFGPAELPHRSLEVSPSEHVGIKSAGTPPALTVPKTHLSSSERRRNAGHSEEHVRAERAAGWPGRPDHKPQGEAGMQRPCLRLMPSSISTGTDEAGAGLTAGGGEEVWPGGPQGPAEPWCHRCRPSPEPAP